MPRQLIPALALWLLSSTASAHDLADGEQTVRLPDGTVYVGEIRGGVFHGEGRLTYPDGDVFYGQFELGLLHGDGTYTGSDGSVFHGFFDAGGSVGEGSIQYADGDLYEGPWRDWKPHGAGTYTSQDSTYHGRFVDGSPDGEFVIHYSNEAVYEGGYKDWMHHGDGVFTTKAGAVYEASFDEGEIAGPATVVDADGNTYVGELSYWQFDGSGTLSRTDGERYEGEFARGEYHGQGSLYRVDGSHYQGNFSNGAFHGQGRLVLSDPAQVLEGRWQRGYYVGENAADYVRQGLAELPIEAVMYAQHTRLRESLDAIPAGVPGEEEVYALTFASYGGEDVFNKEAQMFRRVAPVRFTNHRAHVELINNRATVLDAPLATATNLAQALQAIGQRMNPSEDLLVTYMTSHGGSDGSLSVQMPGIRLDDLSGAQLNTMLDEAGIKWRIIMVSACYSGALISELANDTSLIMTSARADRTSFGCGNDSDATYFGKALVDESLLLEDTLEDAFFAARRIVRAREMEQRVGDFSEPQIHVGKLIREKLARYDNEHNTNKQ